MKTDRLIERYIDYRGLEPRQLSLESDSYSCNWVKKKKGPGELGIVLGVWLREREDKMMSLGLQALVP